MKIDPNKYDYVMYVDASGDDGFKFDHDSSICYVAAALLVKQEDIEHNLAILGQIKKIVGCKQTDEVKYSRIRRHRQSHEALSLLQNIYGKLSCYVIFKKEIDSSSYIGNKKMSVICHYMALSSLKFFKLKETEKVLIAIDRMKQTEEQPLKYVVDSRMNRENVSVTFRDSKDSNFLLIQIADLLCGAIREHFEQYETNADMLYFARTCPPCRKLHKMHRTPPHPICKHGKSHATKIINSKALKYVMPLFPVSHSFDMMKYFYMEPAYMMGRHFYLICENKK